MSPESVEAAASEARRFLDRVKVWQKVKDAHEVNGHVFSEAIPIESGALRRASMDLTRSLAAMRRPA